VDTANLFKMQAALDRHIEAEHNLENEDLAERKILALLVELGELANETRCFKFWSLKGPSATETILEEYVDGIHFILSLGIEGGFQETISAWQLNGSQSTDLTAQFLTLYGVINAYRAKQNQDAYQTLFTEYMTLGAMLGFTPTDVENAYFEKNKVNYERQQQGY
jgi:dimeric dUTPase (all-alpha-NTP-PPase superfamily)